MTFPIYFKADYPAIDIMKLKRCFIATELPLEIIEEIKKIQKLIETKHLFKGKSTKTDNLHLTLKFLGHIDESKVDQVRQKLREIDFERFEGELGDIGVFSKNNIRIIWIEIIGGVFELQKSIDEKLSNLFNLENRFMSHITIARVKQVNDKRKLIENLENMRYKKIKFSIDSFYLMESELRPRGPIYKKIEKYRLKS
ncbi:MAG: RNA 2',3'-cyclic phosphodiesterase [Nanoarchaeota archaeon]